MYCTCLYAFIPVWIVKLAGVEPGKLGQSDFTESTNSAGPEQLIVVFIMIICPDNCQIIWRVLRASRGGNISL